MSDTKGDGFGKEAQEFGPRPGCLGYRKPAPPARADFKKWAPRDSWHIAEGAMLILGFESFDLKQADWEHGLPSTKGFDDIYETALRSDVFRAEGHWARPRHFLAWAQEKDYLVPPELEEAVSRFHPAAVVAEGTPGGSAPGPKWPWGSYETKLLCDLAAAAERFWKNYDPSDQTTANTNQVVIDWLNNSRGVTKHVAEVMATILRAEGLPTRPRK